jgi:ribosomal protein L1
MAKIGLKEFENDAIFTNFDALVRAIVLKKPESLKGKK